MRAALLTIRQNDYTCECFPVKAITFRKTHDMAEIIEQGKCGANLTWTLDDEGLLTISGEGKMNNYLLPFFPDSPFKNNTNVTKVKISHGVTSIGEEAFYGCKGLKSIEIPNSVTSIGDYAFSGCEALTSIEIPNSVTSIGYHAFSGCEALTSIEIPNSVTSIEDYAFSECKALTNIEIPDSVTSIGERAFEGCKALTNITIPNSVTKIEEEAFEGCEALTSIEIPNSVTSIGYRAFSGCKALTSITIPNSVTTIGDLTFAGCKALTSIEIPNSVTSVGNGAFSGCIALTSIEIPNSVTSIGDYAFSGCEALTSINVAEDNANYISIDGVLYDKEKKTLIECPEGKTSIEIPSSVTSIGSSAFARCYSLTSIDATESNANYASIDGVLYDKEKRTLIQCPGGKTNIEIPNSVTSIGDYAFEGCTALTSIEIGGSVHLDCRFNGFCRRIGLTECKKLTTIEIAEGMTSIGKEAFSGCKTLTSIEIPNSVTSIGNYAFEGCEALTSIHIRCEHPEDLRIDENAFYETNIENCTLYVPIGTGYAYRHHPVFSKFKEVIIEK